MARKQTHVTEVWAPKVVAQLNGYEARPVRITGEFAGHTRLWPQPWTTAFNNPTISEDDGREHSHESVNLNSDFHLPFPGAVADAVTPGHSADAQK